MLGRLERTAPWLSVLGAMALVLGMGVDVLLHQLNPHLAEQESLFTLANPGHFLMTLGAALTVLGAAFFLLGRFSGWRRHGWGWRLAAIMPITLLLAVSGLSTALAVGGGTNAVHEHGVSAAVTQQEPEAATKLVNDVRRGTERLADLAAAQTEGYRQITPTRMGMAHYYNPGYARDGRTLDPERPETLLYQLRRYGTQQLAGVMFLMPPGEPGPRVGGALTAWHAHEGLCYSATTGMLIGVVGDASGCGSGKVYQAKTPEMLHVWLVDNPNGVFADRLAFGTQVKLRLQRSDAGTK